MIEQLIVPGVLLSCILLGVAIGAFAKKYHGGACPDLDGLSLQERLERYRNQEQNGGAELKHFDKLTSYLNENEKMGIIMSRKDVRILLYSLDYHWHRMSKHGKGNTNLEPQVDRIRKTMRQHCENAFGDRLTYPIDENSLKDTSKVK